MDSVTQILREILLAGEASSQADIKKRLFNHGVECSQSKISRLLSQIGAVKVIDDKGKTHYRLPNDVGLLHELSPIKANVNMQQWVLSIQNNGALIVVQTAPGAASMVARLIDQNRMALKIMGSIAGDDTIFITPKNLKEIDITQKDISVLLKL